jgi:hypothetical protein
MSVILTDPVTSEETHGQPRNFSLVNVKGEWHEGWQTIQFNPSAKENDFLNDKALWTGNTLVLKNFVHPNRWQSLYGKNYFAAKAMVARLKAEASWLKSECARLEAAGIQYSTTGEGAKKVWPKSVSSGESIPIKVPAFQLELDLPEPTNEFPLLEENVESLVAAAQKAKYYSYTLAPHLNFICRGVELAMFKHGFRDDAKTQEKMPGWIKDAQWARGYKLPRKRVEWNRLVLFQPAVGETGVALRYRIYEKSERVAAD